MQYCLRYRPVAVAGMARHRAADLYFRDFLFSVDPAPAAEAEKMAGVLDKLKTGDKVTTSGGLRGTIMALKDDGVHLRVPPNNLLLK